MSDISDINDNKYDYDNRLNYKHIKVRLTDKNNNIKQKYCATKQKRNKFTTPFDPKQNHIR